MIENENYIESLQIKLLNTLKGSALSVISANDKMKSPQQKIDEMKAIEKFKDYIQNYQHNIEILNRLTIKDDMELC